MSSAQNSNQNSFTPGGNGGIHPAPGRSGNQVTHHGTNVHRAPSAHGVRDLPGGGSISFTQQPISKTLPSATSQAITGQNFPTSTQQFVLDPQQNYRLSGGQIGSQPSSAQPPPAYTRNSPETRVIQAVPPFGVRDSTTAISQHCLAESQVINSDFFIL